MLILAGVSLNAIIGDNGIITQAQNATMLQRVADLQDYMDNYYISNIDYFDAAPSKIAALKKLQKSKNWLYNGKLGYVVDASGEVHYYFEPENIDEEIKKIIGNYTHREYSDYYEGRNVWGITEDYKVYYSEAQSDGTIKYYGSNLNFYKESGELVAFKSDSAFAKLISDSGSDVNVGIVRSKNEITINQDSGITDLSELYNFTSLTKLELDHVNMSSLEGIEFCPNIEYVCFKYCKIGDYSKLSKLQKLKYLYFLQADDEEIRKLCDNSIGIGGKDLNIDEFGIYGYQHYIFLGGRYDTRQNPEVHSSFSRVDYLSNLSTNTKNSIHYLYLNNNSLSNIDNLWEFTNVQVLRIEDNYITSLKGLYNYTENKGMGSLVRLLAADNKLGYELESEDANKLTDSLSYLVDSNKYGIVKPCSPFTKLANLDLKSNTFLKHVEYLKELESISVLYLDGINTLINSSVLSISKLINKITTANLNNFTINKSYRDYLSDNDLSNPTLELSGRAMTKLDFVGKVSSRTNLINLDVSGLILTDSAGNRYSDTLHPVDEEGKYIAGVTMTETFNEVFNAAFGGITTIENLRLDNLPYLTDVDFFRTNLNLKYISMVGNAVSDLSDIETYLLKIYCLKIDNSDIDLTTIQGTINRLYDNYLIRDGTYTTDNYAQGDGILITSQALRDKLIYCTEITQWESYYRDSKGGQSTIDGIWHLENTKIRNMQTTYTDGHFFLPTTIEYVHFQPVYPSTGAEEVVFIDNQAALSKLTRVQLHWFRVEDETYNLIKNLPNLQQFDFYGQCNLIYLNKIPNPQNLRRLYVYGYAGNQYNESLENANLVGIENFINLEVLRIYYNKKLTQLPDKLTCLGSLNEVMISNTGINNLYALRNASALASLYVHYTELQETGFYINDDGSTTNCDNMQIIKSLNKKYSKNNESLADANLSTLYLYNTKITDFSEIENLEWYIFKTEE